MRVDRQSTERIITHHRCCDFWDVVLSRGFSFSAADAFRILVRTILGCRGIAFSTMETTGFRSIGEWVVAISDWTQSRNPEKEHSRRI
jgi:hypothetical protein